MKVALCVVAGGDVYLRYAEQLFESAREHFMRDDDVDVDLELRLIPGDEGWPNGTMMRPKHLVSAMPEADFVFVCDADMRFEAPVGREILPAGGSGIVVTQHPGYWGQPPATLPFENRPESACFVPLERRRRYFCGGFWGGSRDEALALARAVAGRIDADLEAQLVPVWHDESALNAVIATWYPDPMSQVVMLDPSYCHPDNDWHYVHNLWRLRLPRRLVALDKPPAERAGR